MKIASEIIKKTQITRFASRNEFLSPASVLPESGRANDSEPTKVVHARRKKKKFHEPPPTRMTSVEITAIEKTMRMLRNTPDHLRVRTG